MKRVLTLISLTFSSICICHSQDMIVTKSGEVIYGYNLEISETAVFYNVSESHDSNLKKLPKADILVIQKQDGSRFEIEDEKSESSATPTKNNSVSDTFGMPDENNGKRISDSHSKKLTFDTPNQKKKANQIVVGYSLTPESIIETSELSLRFSKPKNLSPVANNGSLSSLLTMSQLSDEGQTPGSNISVTPIIENKTKDVLYVDLGASFYVSGEESHILFSSSVSTDVQTTSAGGSIGIISSGTASSSVQTIVEQRIISIPPMGSVDLKNYNITAGKTIQNLLTDLFGTPYPERIKNRYVGQYTDLSGKDMSSYSITVGITYSTNDKFDGEKAMLNATYVPEGLMSVSSKLLDSNFNMDGLRTKGIFYIPVY